MTADEVSKEIMKVLNEWNPLSERAKYITDLDTINTIKTILRLMNNFNLKQY
jgi:hypothetical protein